MSRFYQGVVVVLFLSMAHIGLGQRANVYQQPATRASQVYIDKKATRVRVTDSLSQYRKRVVNSFLDRFQPNGTTYSDRYDSLQAEAKRQRCAPMLTAWQQVVDQLARIEQLLSETRYGLLSQEKQAGSLPIIDSLVVRKGQRLFMHIHYTITSGFGCIIPGINMNAYPTLTVLQQQRQVIIEGRFQSYQAQTVSVLPRVTGNTPADAANYLNTIQRLLQLYYAQLQTSFREYRVYERNQNLATDTDLLNFRREFCSDILCEVASK